VRKWLRVVLPPTWVLACFGVLYVGAEVGLWAVDECFRRLAENLQVPAEDWAKGTALRAPLVVYLAAILFGVFRATAFHPFYRPGYHGWLRHTPWHAGQPLPLGPLHFVPQDAVLVLLLTALAAPKIGWACYRVPLVFLAVHSLMLGGPLFATGARGYGYATIFLLGLAVRLAPFPAGCVGAVLAAVGVAHLGLRRTLAGYPWELRGYQSLQTPEGWTRPPGPKALGWPFTQQGPKFPDVVGLPLRWADIVSCSLSVGWWFYALGALLALTPDGEGGLAVWYGMVCLGAVVGRLVLYCDGYQPPISLAGRWATGRWVIPGYDRVFVAPLCTLATGVGVPVGLLLLGCPAHVAYPVATFLVLLTAQGLGPDLSTWRLTGEHRIAPGWLAPGRFLKVG
jgi:hypothetical protein